MHGSARPLCLQVCVVPQSCEWAITCFNAIASRTWFPIGPIVVIVVLISSDGAARTTLQAGYLGIQPDSTGALEGLVYANMTKIKLANSSYGLRKAPITLGISGSPIIRCTDPRNSSLSSHVPY
jgi:hypothetical protein